MCNLEFRFTSTYMGIGEGPWLPRTLTQAFFMRFRQNSRSTKTQGCVKTQTKNDPKLRFPGFPGSYIRECVPENPKQPRKINENVPWVFSVSVHILVDSGISKKGGHVVFRGGWGVSSYPTTIRKCVRADYYSPGAQICCRDLSKPAKSSYVALDPPNNNKKNICYIRRYLTALASQPRCKNRFFRGPEFPSCRKKAYISNHR